MKTEVIVKAYLCAKPFPLGLTCILTLQGKDSTFHVMGGDTEAQRGKMAHSWQINESGFDPKLLGVQCPCLIRRMGGSQAGEANRDQAG